MPKCTKIQLAFFKLKHTHGRTLAYGEYILDVRFLISLVKLQKSLIENNANK